MPQKGSISSRKLIFKLTLLQKATSTSPSKPEKPSFFSPKRLLGKSKEEYTTDYSSLSNDGLEKKNVSSRLKRSRELSATVTSKVHAPTGFVYHAPAHAARVKKLNAKVGATDDVLKENNISRPSIDWGDRLWNINKGVADGAFHYRTAEQAYKTSQKPAVKQAVNNYFKEVREAYATGDWNPTYLMDP